MKVFFYVDFYQQKTHLIKASLEYRFSNRNMINKVHSFTDDILGNLDAVAIATLIKNKYVSVKEVLEATINRAEKVNPHINAIMTKDFKRALDKAEKNNNGFFAGIPIFFKDLTNIEGLPTYHGSEAFANVKPSKKSDPIAKQIFSMGFINLGMSTMPEFGFTCSTEYPDLTNTKNPWNLEYSVGGSSGGAGALVAAGVVPLAHSADGGGSTRIPAACCGLVGLKASRGRIKLSDIFARQIIEICIDGIVSRSVRDTAHFYAEAEKYYHNKKLPSIGLVNRPLEKKLNIGFTHIAGQNIVADKASIEALDETTKLLEQLGHTVKLVQMPVSDEMVDYFKYLWAMNAFIVKKFGKVLFKDFNPKKLTKLSNGLAKYYWANMRKTPTFIKALKHSGETYKQFLEENKIDVLLTPTLAHLTPELGYIGTHLDFETIFSRMAKWACFTPFANATGSPSLTLPLQHYKEKNLPIGMMFGAGFGQERLLLELALQLEEAKPWKKINE